jgi:hypothetical protein
MMNRLAAVLAGAIAALSFTVSAEAQVTDSTQVQVRLRSWHRLNNTCATSISASDGVTPWVVGCTGGDANGYPVLYASNYDTNAGSSSWTQVNATAALVAVGSAVWIARRNGTILDGAWTSAGHVDWHATNDTGLHPVQLSASTDDRYDTGAAALLGGSSTTDGYPFWRLDGCPTCTVAISAFYWGGAGISFSQSPDSSGYWAVGRNHGVFYSTGGILVGKPNAWSPLPGCATWISGGPNSTAYAVGCDGDVHYWNGSGWTSTGFLNKDMREVSVGYASGRPNAVWGIDLGGTVWVYE